MLMPADESRRKRRAMRLCAMFAAGCLCASLLGFAGCAPKRSPTTRSVTTQPVEKSDAFLPLDQLPNRPDLAAISPATQPDEEPSLDAIELYARARGAIVDGERFNAVSYLERAVAADPYSFLLRYDLAKSYADSATQTDHAVEAFESAAKIEPDNIDVQCDLGQQYLARDDADNALRHLRLAVQTSGYKTEEDIAALTDFYLARALQNKGL